MPEENNYTLARKKYWNTISKEDRTTRARNAAIAKHKSSTPEQKRELAMKMVEGRRKKLANG